MHNVHQEEEMTTHQVEVVVSQLPTHSHQEEEVQMLFNPSTRMRLSAQTDGWLLMNGRILCGG
jgi:hypothetical protein